ncbi:MAG: 3-deoxy-manno-octulosonate cytidylyltransferase [Congregibacter sp.]
MSFVVVIPARYSSTRLPGKPLLSIAGKPMIQHVWERAQQSEAERIVIATDDERIEKIASAFGAEVILTSPDHASGTDRLAEVVTTLGFDGAQILVNVQGDEPLIPPSVINQVALNLRRCDDANIATLCETISEPSVLLDPNAVKVVFDCNGMALYFSRACIPYPRQHNWESGDMPQGNWFRHLGLYAYRASFLERFSAWPSSQLEETESLEQLRALSQGEGIHVEPAIAPVPGGIDTPQDLQETRVLLGDDLSGAHDQDV